MKHQIEKLHDKRRNHHDAKDDADAAVAETTQRLRRAIDDLETERQRVEALNDKLRKCESDLETIPLLRAQVRSSKFKALVEVLVRPENLSCVCLCGRVLDRGWVLIPF